MRSIYDWTFDPETKTWNCFLSDGYIKPNDWGEPGWMYHKVGSLDLLVFDSAEEAMDHHVEQERRNHVVTGLMYRAYKELQVQLADHECVFGTCETCLLMKQLKRHLELAERVDQLFWSGEISDKMLAEMDRVAARAATIRHAKGGE